MSNNRPTLSRRRLPPTTSLSSSVPKMGGVSTPFKGGTYSAPVDGLNPIESLLQQVKGLAPAGQKELLDQLAALQLLNQKTEAGRDNAMWADAVYTALVEAIGAGDAGVAGPLALRKVVAAGTAWQHVESFMQVSKLSALQVVERQAAYNLLARLLVGHARFVARKSGAPLSGKLVASCSTNLAGVFEAAFPGYVSAGLARVVIRSQPLNA